MTAPNRRLRLASRGSPLALTQSRAVIDMITPHLAGATIEIQTITTRGDARRDVPLTQLGEGVFVKAIEAELLAHRADLAVHSLKDVPSAETPSLTIAAVPAREDPRDAIITRDGKPFAALPTGALLATGSPRRIAQLRALRPDLRFTGVRGNVDTRIRKLDEGEFDGLVMAVAGLRRLGLEARISTVFTPEECTPAVAQGALGVQCRADDAEVVGLLARIDAEWAHSEATAERAFLSAIGGGCRVPVGALATREETALTIRGVVADPNGMQVARAVRTGAPGDGERLGRELAQELQPAMARLLQHLGKDA